MAKDKVFLVLVSEKGAAKRLLEESFSEMRELVRSAQGEVVMEVTAPLQRPNARTYIGEGKVREIGERLRTGKADCVVFSVDLSPTQARNLEEGIGGTRVVDRTGLILDIFAQRARSREGSLQVELAQLQYLLPRLAGFSPGLSRLGGGIGTRGPGEQKLEVDRRRIRTRIQRIEEDLKRVEIHRGLLRSRRQAGRVFTVSLVGYTNAGKSTLLNSLTRADAYVAPKLFATLDPTTRILRGAPTEPPILFTDTVGFIADLPVELIRAFHATLEEVKLADLLLHVVDASSPCIEEHIRAVEGILSDIGCRTSRSFLVLNKSDLLTPVQKASLLSLFPHGFLISALRREGLETLQAELQNSARRKFEEEGRQKP